MVSDNQLRLAVIAGASNALKYKEDNRRATDREALKHVTENVDKILREIEEN